MSMDDVMKIRNEKLKECLIDNIDRPPVNMGRLAALTTQIRTQMPDDGISGGILNSLTSSNHKPMELITPIRIKKILNEEEGGEE